jgi:hypothetical protein
MWQSKREISRECNDINGSAKGSHIWEEMIMMALLHMAGLENSECIWKIQRKPEMTVSVQWLKSRRSDVRWICWPNYIVTLPRYFSFRLPHLNIPTGPPSDELDKNSQPIVYLYYCYYTFINLYVGFPFFYVCSFICASSGSFVPHMDRQNVFLKL